MAFVSIEHDTLAFTADRAFQKISELERQLQVLHDVSDEDFSDDLKKNQ